MEKVSSSLRIPNIYLSFAQKNQSFQMNPSSTTQSYRLYLQTLSRISNFLHPLLLTCKADSFPLLTFPQAFWQRLSSLILYSLINSVVFRQETVRNYDQHSVGTLAEGSVIMALAGGWSYIFTCAVTLVIPLLRNTLFLHVYVLRCYQGPIQ